ncbi:hypothetical protein ACLB2K_006452 [Fragaria x ananassa]
MAKISTLAGMLLVLWLAMSIGTLATKDGKPPTEKEMQEWINVLREAEVALEADNFQTASARVAELVARLDNTNLPDHEKLAKFVEMLKIVEQAVDEDNKAKAIVLITAIGASFEQQYGNAQGGGDKKRELLGDEVPQSKIMEVMGYLREASRAIEQVQYASAQEVMNTVYQNLNNDKQLCKEGKVLEFLNDINDAEQALKEDYRTKALESLNQAAGNFGVPMLHE